MNHKFSLAIEEAELALAMEPVTAEEPAEAELNMDLSGVSLSPMEADDGDLVNMQDVGEEIAAAAGDFEVAVESLKTLIDLRALVRRNTSQGLSRVSAESVSLTLESIRERLGAPVSFIAMPALESFEADGKCVEATNVALEAAITKAIGKIWQSALTSIKRIASNIRDFFTSYEKVYIRYIARLEELAKRVPELKDFKMKSVSLGEKGLAKELTYDGSTANIDSAMKLVQNTLNICENTFANYKAVVTICSEIMQNLADPDKKIPQLVDKLSGVEQKILSSLPPARIKGSAFESRKSFGPIIGYKVVIIDKSVVVINGVAHSSNSVSIMPLPSDVKAIDAIPADKLGAFIAMVLKLAKTNLAVLKKDTATRWGLDALTSAVENSVHESSKESKADKKDPEFHNLRKLLKSVNDIVTLTHYRVPYSAFQATRAAFRYAEASVKNLEAPV